MLINTSEYILFINIIDPSVKIFFFICDFRGQNIILLVLVILSTLHNVNNAIFHCFEIIQKFDIIIILYFIGKKCIGNMENYLFRKN